ncbi:MAG: hypothetical protein WC718_09955 [Phycisphaerales bacterium]|jgi:hypothetical protein
MTDNPNDFWKKPGQPSDGNGSTPPDSGLRGQAPKQEPKFWAKEKAEPEKPAGEPNAWESATAAKQREQAEREALLKDPNLKRKRRRRLVRNIVLSVVGVFVLALVLGVVFAPQIASSIAPGYAKDAVNGSIKGKLDLSSMSLSWGGPQVIEGIKLSDPEGHEIATLNVEAQAGLWGLATGGLDLGEVKITKAKATVVREADGTTNIQRAVAPKVAAKPSKSSSPASSGPAKLPAGLNVKLIVKDLAATFIDKAAAGGTPLTVALKDVDVTAGVTPGKPLNVDISARAIPGLAPAGDLGGTVAIKAKIEKWSASDGRLLLENSSGTADISLQNIPVELIDAVMPLAAAAPGERAPTLREALGPKLQMAIKASGDSSAANATIDVRVDNASVSGDFDWAKNVLTTKKPFVLTAKGSAIGALSPAAAKAIKSSPQARFDALPDVTLSVDKLRFVIVPGAKSLPLRGAAATVTLDTTAMSGELSLPNQPKQKFGVAPLHVSVETADLGAGVHIAASSNATIGQTPAGELAVDLNASGLLDEAGALKGGMPGSLKGDARFTKVATVIAQPFVQALNIDLPKDIGPTLDIALVATSADKPGAGDLDVTIRSDKLSLVGGVRLADTGVTLKGEGLKLDASSAGAIASRFVAPSTGWKLAPKDAGGSASVVVKTLNLPRNADGSFKMDQLAADAQVQLSGLTVTAVDASGNRRADAPGDIDVSRVTFAAGLKPGGNATAGLDAACAFAGSPFTAIGNFDIKSLLSVVNKDGASSLQMAPPMTIRPSGKLELKDLPPALAGLFVPPPAAPKPGEAPGLDTGKLVVDSLGGPLTVTLSTKPVAGDAKAIDLSLVAASARFAADAGVVLDAQKAQLRKTTIGTTLAPATLDTLLRAYAPDLAKGSAARLAGPAQLRLEIDPVAVGIDANGKPQLDHIGMANVLFGMPGQTNIDGLALMQADGTKKEIGRLTVQDLLVRADLPVSALTGPSRPEDRHAKVILSGLVLGDKGQTVVRLDGNVETDIAEGKLAGPLAASFKLGNLDTATLEALSGKEGLITGFLGATAQVETTVALGQPPAGKTYADAPIDATLAITAPRVKSDGPIRVSITPERIELKNPASLSVEPDVAAANRFLAAAQADKNVQATQGQKPSEKLTLVESAPITLVLNKFSMARAAPASDKGGAAPANPSTPMKAADIGVSLTLPRTRLMSGENTPISLTDASFSVTADGAALDAKGKPPVGGPAINFKLQVGEAVVGTNPPAKGMSVSGQVTRAFGPTGAFDVSQALLAVLADLPMVPTALVDTLLNQKGALNDGLGPTTSVKATVERYPLTPPPPDSQGRQVTQGAPPLLDFDMKSERATMSIRGTIVNGVFVSEQPLNIRIIELTSAMSARYIGVMPLIGIVEKTGKQQAGNVTGSNLQVPLDNDLTKLNGDVRVEPGECRFETSGAFKEILSALNQKTEGSLGRRLDPLDLKIRSGIVTYDKWSVPFGEFNVQTEGTVDLVQRQVDVITWVPFGALSDKASQAFMSGMGGFLGKASPVLDALTLVPFRTKGPLNKPTTSPDFELAGKNLLKSLKPEDLIKKGLGDLLKDKLKFPSPK